MAGARAAADELEASSIHLLFLTEAERRRVCALGLRVVEVPITFSDRRLGRSKMSASIFVEALYRVWQVRGHRREARSPHV